MWAQIGQCWLLLTLKRPWLIALHCQVSNHFPWFWCCTFWLLLTSLEQHQATTVHLLVAGPTVFLCYQLKVCEIAPRPLVGSFFLSPLPPQRFQRTGPFFGLVLCYKTNEGQGEKHCRFVTFWTLVLFLFVCLPLLISLLFFLFFRQVKTSFEDHVWGQALECHWVIFESFPCIFHSKWHISLPKCFLISFLWF